MASIRVHRERKLVQRIFILTSNRRRYSSDSCFITVQLHQKTSWSCFPACLCWPQKPFALGTGQGNLLGQVYGQNSKPENSDYSFCCFLCSQMWREDTFTHLCTKDKMRNKGGCPAFPTSLFFMAVCSCFFNPSHMLGLSTLCQLIFQQINCDILLIQY